MASKQPLEVGIRIGATNDGATETIQGIVNKANSSVRGLVSGLASLGTADKIKGGLTDASNAFADQQYSFAKLRILEMNRMGQVNEDVYGQEEGFIRGLSSKYAKTTEDYTKMVVVMRQNRISAQDILGGIGESGAKLGKAFDNLDPDKSALLFSRLKNDMRVSSGEMDKLANMAYKLYNIGIGGGDANSAVNELTEAYSKASLGATNLGLGGEKDAEELGILMGTFIAKGLTGTSVGTNFRRIFDGLTDPKKVGGVMQRGLQLGVKLDFYDGNGKFKGLKNFEDQLAKMKNLNALQRGYVLQPFGGKQGLSTDFLQYLSHFSGDIGDIRKQYDGIATLDDAVNQLVGTLQIQNDKTASAKRNMMAAFGKATAGDVQRLNELLQWTYNGLANISNNSGEISTITQEFLGGAAAALSIYGALKLVGTAIPGIASLAQGLGASFAWAGPLFAGLLAAKGIWDTFKNDKAAMQAQIAANPNSVRTRNLLLMQQEIDDPNRSAIGRHLASWIQAGIVRNSQIFGDNSEGATNSGFTKANPNILGMSYAPINDPNNPYTKSYNDHGNLIPQLTYSPNLVVPPGAIGNLSESDINRIFQANSEDLMRKLAAEGARQRNMTYGNP